MSNGDYVYLSTDIHTELPYRQMAVELYENKIVRTYTILLLRIIFSFRRKRMFGPSVSLRGSCSRERKRMGNWLLLVSIAFCSQVNDCPSQLTAQKRYSKHLWKNLHQFYSFSQIMLQGCWHEHPDCRFTFGKLKIKLERIYSELITEEISSEENNVASTSEYVPPVYDNIGFRCNRFFRAS